VASGKERATSLQSLARAIDSEVLKFGQLSWG